MSCWAVKRKMNAEYQFRAVKIFCADGLNVVVKECKRTDLWLVHLFGDRKI